LSPAHTRSLSPTSFHPHPLSRALRPPPEPTEDPRPPCQPSKPPGAAPSHPEPAQTSLIKPPACALAFLSPPISVSPRLRALTPSLPLPGGAGLSVPVSFACVPTLSLCPTDPAHQRYEPFSPRPHSLLLRRGASLSAPPSPQTAVDQRARTLRTPATSPAHAPYLPFEHRSRPLSLPCLISPTPTLSCALSPTPKLAGDPRQPCRPSKPLVAASGLPEHRPKVRNSLPCSVSLIFVLLWPILPHRSSVTPVRCAHAATDQISLTPALVRSVSESRLEGG
jgi:hypothetical protein